MKNLISSGSFGNVNSNTIGMLGKRKHKNIVSHIAVIKSSCELT